MQPDSLDKILSQAVHKSGVGNHVYLQRSAHAEEELKQRAAQLGKKKGGNGNVQAQSRYSRALLARSKILQDKEKAKSQQVEICHHLLEHGSLRQRMEEMFRVACSHGPDLEFQLLSRGHWITFLKMLGVTTASPYYVFQPFSTVSIKASGVKGSETFEQVSLNRLGVENIERVFEHAQPPVSERPTSPDHEDKLDFPAFMVALQELLRLLVPAEVYPPFSQPDHHRQLMCSLCLEGFGKRYVSQQRPSTFDEFNMSETLVSAIRDEIPLLADVFLWCVDPAKFDSWSQAERDDMYVQLSIGECYIEVENFLELVKRVDLRYAVTSTELVYRLFERYDAIAFDERVTVDFAAFQLIILHLAFGVYQTSGEYPTPQARFYALVHKYFSPMFPKRETLAVRRDNTEMDEIKPTNAVSGHELWVFGNFQIRETRTGARCPLYVRFGEGGPVSRGTSMSTSVASVVVPRVPDTEDTVTTAHLSQQNGMYHVAIRNTTLCPVFASSDRLQWTSSLEVMLTYERDVVSFFLDEGFITQLQDVFLLFSTRPPPSSPDLPMLEQLLESPWHSCHMFVGDWSKVCQAFPLLGVQDDGDPSLLIQRHPKFFETAKPHSDSKVNALLPSLDFAQFIECLFKLFIEKYGSTPHILKYAEDAFKSAESVCQSIRSSFGPGTQARKKIKPAERQLGKVVTSCVNCGQDPSVKTADTAFFDLELEDRTDRRRKKNEDEDIGMKFLKSVGQFMSNTPDEPAAALSTEELQLLKEEQVARLGLRGKFMYLAALMAKSETVAEEKRTADEIRYENSIESVKSSGKYLTIQLLKLQQCVEGISDTMFRMMSIVQETEQTAREERKLRLSGAVNASETMWAMITQLFEGLKQSINSTRELAKPYVESMGTEANGELDVDAAAEEAKLFKERILQQSVALEERLKKKKKEVTDGPEALARAATLARRQTLQNIHKPDESDLLSETTESILEESQRRASVPVTPAHTGPTAEEMQSKLNEQKEKLQLEWTFKLKESERKKDAALKEASNVLTDLLRFSQENIDIPPVIANPAFKYLSARGVNVPRAPPRVQHSGQSTIQMKPVLPTDSTGVQSDEDEFPSLVDMQTEMQLRGLNNAQKLGPAGIMIRRGLNDARNVLGKYISNTELFDTFSKIIKLEMQNAMHDNSRMKGMIQMPKSHEMKYKDATVCTLLRDEHFLEIKKSILEPQTATLSTSVKKSTKSKGSKKSGSKGAGPKNLAPSPEELEKQVNDKANEKNHALVAAMHQVEELSKGCQTDAVNISDPVAEANAKKHEEIDALLEGFQGGAEVSDGDDEDTTRSIRVQTDRTKLSGVAVQTTIVGDVIPLEQLMAPAVSSTGTKPVPKEDSDHESSSDHDEQGGGNVVKSARSSIADTSAKTPPPELAVEQPKVKKPKKAPKETKPPTAAFPSTTAAPSVDKQALEDLKKRVEAFRSQNAAAIAKPEPKPAPSDPLANTKPPLPPANSTKPQVAQVPAAQPAQQLSSKISTPPVSDPPGSIQTSGPGSVIDEVMGSQRSGSSVPPSAGDLHSALTSAGVPGGSSASSIPVAPAGIRTASSDLPGVSVPYSATQPPALSDEEYEEEEEEEEEEDIDEKVPKMHIAFPSAQPKVTPSLNTSIETEQANVPVEAVKRRASLQKGSAVLPPKSIKSPGSGNANDESQPQEEKFESLHLTPRVLDPAEEPAHVEEALEQEEIVENHMAHYLKEQAKAFANTQPLASLKPMYDDDIQDVIDARNGESPLSEYEDNSDGYSVDRSLRRRNRQVFSAPIGGTLLPVRRKKRHQPPEFDQSPTGSPKAALDSAFSHLTTPPDSAFPMTGVNSAEANEGANIVRQSTVPLTPRTEKLLLAGDWQKVASGGDNALTTSMMIDGDGNYLVQGKDGKYYRVPLGTPKKDAVQAANTLLSPERQQQQQANPAPDSGISGGLVEPSGATTTTAGGSEAASANEVPASPIIPKQSSSTPSKAVSEDGTGAEETGKPLREIPSWFLAKAKPRTLDTNPLEIGGVGKSKDHRKSPDSPEGESLQIDTSVFGQPVKEDMSSEDSRTPRGKKPRQGPKGSLTKWDAKALQPMIKKEAPLEQGMVLGGKGLQSKKENPKAEKSEASKRTKKLGADSKEQFERMMRDADGDADVDDADFGRPDHLKALGGPDHLGSTLGVGSPTASSLPSPTESALSVATTIQRRGKRKTKAKPGQLTVDPYSHLWGGGFSVQKESVGSQLVRNETTGEMELQPVPEMDAMSELVRQMRDRVETLSSESEMKGDALGSLKDELTRLRRQLLDAAANKPFITRVDNHASKATDKQLEMARGVLADRDNARSKIVRMFANHSPKDLERFLKDKNSTGIIEMTDFLEMRFVEMKKEFAGADSLAKSSAEMVKRHFPEELTLDYDKRCQTDPLFPLRTLQRRVDDEIRASTGGLYDNTSSSGQIVIPTDYDGGSVMGTVLEKIQSASTYTLEKVVKMIAAHEDGDFDTTLQDTHSSGLDPSTGLPLDFTAVDLKEDLFPVSDHLKQARRPKDKAGVSGGQKQTTTIATQTKLAPVVVMKEKSAQCEFTQRVATPSFLATAQPLFASEETQTDVQLDPFADVFSEENRSVNLAPSVVGSPLGKSMGDGFFATSVNVFNTGSRVLKVSTGTQAVAFYAPKASDLNWHQVEDATQTTDDRFTKGIFYANRPCRPQLARLYFMARQFKDSTDVLMNWLQAASTAVRSKEEDEQFAAAQQLNALRKLTKNAKEVGMTHVVISMMERGLDLLNDQAGLPLDKYIDHSIRVDPSTVLPSEIHCEEMNYLLTSMLSQVDKRLAHPDDESIRNDQRALNRYRHRVIEEMSANLDDETYHFMEEKDRLAMSRLVDFSSLTSTQQRRLFQLQVQASSLCIFHHAQRNSYIGLAKASGATGSIPLSLSAASSAHIRMAKTALCHKVIPREFSDLEMVDDLTKVTEKTRDFINDVLTLNIEELSWLGSFDSNVNSFTSKFAIASDSRAQAQRKRNLTAEENRIEELLDTAMKLHLHQPCKDMSFTSWIYFLRQTLKKLLGPRGRQLSQQLIEIIHRNDESSEDEQTLPIPQPEQRVQTPPTQETKREQQLESELPSVIRPDVTMPHHQHLQFRTVPEKDHTVSTTVQRNPVNFVRGWKPTPMPDAVKKYGSKKQVFSYSALSAGAGTPPPAGKRGVLKDATPARSASSMLLNPLGTQSPLLFKSGVVTGGSQNKVGGRGLTTNTSSGGNGGAAPPQEHNPLLNNIFSLHSINAVRNLTPVEQRDLLSVRSVCTQSAIAESVDSKTLKHWIDLELRNCISEQRNATGLDGDVVEVDEILDRVRTALARVDSGAEENPQLALKTLTPAQSRLFVQYLRGLPVRGGARLPTLPSSGSSISSERKAGGVSPPPALKPL